MASESRPTGLIATKGIELLTFRTPNGHKASILLEELKEAYGLEYTFQCIDLSKGVNKEAWFKALNPSAKIPVIVDHDNNDFAIPESQAILNYLVRLYDTENKFSFKDPFDLTRCEQWLSFSTGELTPNQSSAIQFYRFMPDRHAFATQKYIGQTERCYGVLDKALEGRDYLVGAGNGKYSIADMANWTYVNFSMATGLGDLGRWKNLEKWWGRIKERAQVVRGTEVPFKVTGLMNESFMEKVENDPDVKKREKELAEELKKAQEKYGYVYSAP